MNRESIPVSNEGDHMYTPASGHVNESSECIKAEPTSSEVSNPDDPKSAAEPVEAGTADTPVKKSSDQEKVLKQLNGKHQQIKLQMELSIHAQDDSDIESYEGDDESRFSINPIEETGTGGRGHWIKTTVVMPYPIGI